jgi:hypothetical protein
MNQMSAGEVTRSNGNNPIQVIVIWFDSKYNVRNNLEKSRRITERTFSINENTKYSGNNVVIF